MQRTPRTLTVTPSGDVEGPEVLPGGVYMHPKPAEIHTIANALIDRFMSVSLVEHPP